jgi:hypothetical protein
MHPFKPLYSAANVFSPQFGEPPPIYIVSIRLGHPQGNTNSTCLFDTQDGSPVSLFLYFNTPLPINASIPLILFT